MITSNDVRRIKMCSTCGELGIYQPRKPGIEMQLVVCTNSLRAPGRAADYKHPMCHAGASVTKLMILPPEERGFIRICDVTEAQMKGLLAASREDRKKGIK